ncbi:hypothetical protein CC78DRAFT_571012 [Lojkania enalia]|uniref:BTB domain-containing protein n=1 Tax=Lojkania enalia TaxID=147567 RepID=A0A9P4K756_9PLEO|nr:hypothetical protein CC78DRAFT_571012 [Didymosphaeria enalia]
MAQYSLPFKDHLQTHTGFPITFLIGPNSTRFDIHNTLLHTLSIPFIKSNGTPKNVLHPIILRSLDPHDFKSLWDWIYDDKPPSYENESDVLGLMKMWVTAGAVAMSSYQNACLRFAMACMQPASFTVPIETVAYVYQHTPPSSKLRKFVITLFVQRSEPQTHFFAPQYAQILRDCVREMKWLHRVRLQNLEGVEGYVLEEEFKAVRWVNKEKRRVEMWYVTEGKMVEVKKLRFPLPAYLVWGENWEALPDGFFVSAGESSEGAVELRGQV